MEALRERVYARVRGILNKNIVLVAEDAKQKKKRKKKIEIRLERVRIFNACFDPKLEV